MDKIRTVRYWHKAWPPDSHMFYEKLWSAPQRFVVNRLVHHKPGQSFLDLTKVVLKTLVGVVVNRRVHHTPTKIDQNFEKQFW